jgi:predicted deacylase
MLSIGELRGAQEPLMARSQSRLTAEIDFNRNGKQHGFIRLPYSVHRSAYGWIPIPVACIKNDAGPRILLMAGNHGDEYEGQVALGKLIRDLEPDEVSGRIIILPSANFPAAMAGMRTSPLDGGNLNRSFPGDPYGGPTEQIADYIESVLLPQCDFVFDFHSGGSSLTYVPSAMMRRPQTPELLQGGIDMLRTFGAPVGYLVDAALGDHTLTAAAARAEVRHMSTEIAGGGELELRHLCHRFDTDIGIALHVPLHYPALFPIRARGNGGAIRHLCLALCRGLGHADIWDAARGRPAYRGHDDAAAREIDP